MILSIITPTLGHSSKLQRLLLSIGEQDGVDGVEVVLSATGVTAQELMAQVPPLPRSFSLEIIESSVAGIAVARNKGLLRARGKYIFFLDDDCILPHRRYLANALERLSTSADDAHAGSYIVRDRHIGFASAFYNYMSHVWLMSFLHQERLHIILGGCAFFKRQMLLDHGVFFEETSDKAAEEFTFSQNLQKKNISISFSESLSVRHDPGCSTLSLFKKSWNHGRALGTYSKRRSQKRMTTLYRSFQDNTFEALRFLPLLILFLLVGRFAFYSRRFEDLAHSIRKPSLKRS